MRPKVTYFTTGLGRGGAEIQLMLLCEKFVKAGWEVGVISLLPPLDFEKELEELGVPLMRLDLSKRFPDPRVFLRLVRTLRKWNPDVLHCHQVHANLIGRVARIFTNIPAIVCTAHGTIEGSRLREWAYRLTDPLCDLTTQVSQAGLERYIRIGAAPPKKICYVRNAIDVDRLIPDEARRRAMRESLGLTDEFLWLAVGNLREAKNYPTMLEAFARVAAEKPSARLFIAGSGLLREMLEVKVRESGLTGVRFLGTRPDVADLMRAADGFLMSSVNEGMPLAILEASALQLPVVATKVGGIPELVSEGKSGFLVEAADAQALASACLRIMNASPERRAQFGQEGRDSVLTFFSPDSVITKWQQVYTQLSQQA